MEYIHYSTSFCSMNMELRKGFPMNPRYDEVHTLHSSTTVLPPQCKLSSLLAANSSRFMNLILD